MYENVRAISWGLILSLIWVTIIAVVAIIDPFKNGMPWVNWLVISIAAVISVVAATWLTAAADSDEDFWLGTLMIVVIWTMVGGGLAWAATHSERGLQATYHPLVWSSYGAPIGLFPVTALAQYLIGAAAHNREQSAAELRRVA